MKRQSSGRQRPSGSRRDSRDRVRSRSPGLFNDSSIIMKVQEMVAAIDAQVEDGKIKLQQADSALGRSYYSASVRAVRARSTGLR